MGECMRVSKKAVTSLCSRIARSTISEEYQTLHITRTYHSNKYRQPVSFSKNQVRFQNKKKDAVIAFSRVETLGFVVN